jgi:hypothetical protein
MMANISSSNMKKILLKLVAASCLMVAPYCYSATLYQCPEASQVQSYGWQGGGAFHCVYKGKIQVSNGSSIDANGTSLSDPGLRGFVRAGVSASTISCYYETNDYMVISITSSPGINFSNCTVNGKVITCPSKIVK